MGQDQDKRKLVRRSGLDGVALAHLAEGQPALAVKETPEVKEAIAKRDELAKRMSEIWSSGSYTQKNPPKGAKKLEEEWKEASAEVRRLQRRADGG